MLPERQKMHRGLYRRCRGQGDPRRSKNKSSRMSTVQMAKSWAQIYPNLEKIQLTRYPRSKNKSRGQGQPRWQCPPFASATICLLTFIRYWNLKKRKISYKIIIYIKYKSLNVCKVKCFLPSKQGGKFQRNNLQACTNGKLFYCRCNHILFSAIILLFWSHFGCCVNLGN